MIPDIHEVIKHYPEFTGIHPACLAVPMMEEEAFKDFVESIKRGQDDPIVLLPGGILLDGRTRLLACYVAGIEPKTETKDVADPWNYVEKHNIDRRHLTTGQKSAFAYERKQYYAGLAKERQLRKPADFVPENFPEQKGDARDKAGESVGTSGRNVDKYGVVVETLPELATQVKSGEIALDKAYREANKVRKSKQTQPAESLKLTGKPKKTKAKPKNKKASAPKPEKTFIVTVGGKKKEIQTPKTSRFNETNDSVDWARWTWNPVTGCEHGCKFCYAREIAHNERMQQFYPFKFTPSFHEYRLDAPTNTNVPERDDNWKDRDGRVFVCSMADLFGKWVPDEWIEKVFAACLAAPEWEYLFLTKWPARYSKMPLLKKAWYGSSVIQQSDVERVEAAMQNFECEGCVKWVSLEPMLGPIRFNDISWCDLLVIGSQTSTTQPSQFGGFQPAIPAHFDWVVDVVNQCRDAGVPYYLKANLGLEVPGMVLPKSPPRRS